MSGMKTVRNGFLDIQKFFYAWIVVIFHFYTYTSEHLLGGVGAVDFFFIASGVFFFAGYKKKTENMGAEEKLNYPVQFIRRRLLRFLPYTLPTFIFAFIVSVVIAKGEMGTNNIIDSFVRNIWEIPLINMAGFNAGKSMINAVTWTISAMLIVEFVILNFLVRNEKLFRSFLAPIAILIGCGFWAQLDGTYYLIWCDFTTFGVIRAFIMTSIGIYAWEASRWLSRINFTKSGKVALTIIEVSMNIFAVISMMYSSNRYYQMLSAVLFAMSTAISVSQSSYTVCNNSITDFLGEWSMSIYISHMPIRDLCYSFFESPYEFYKIKYIYGILVIIVSLVFLFFARWIISAAPKSIAKVKNFFVNEGSDS